ncbi:MAG: LicD family protein [Candidatus Eremiobacterota bacterium]
MNLAPWLGVAVGAGLWLLSRRLPRHVLHHPCITPLETRQQLMFLLESFQAVAQRYGVTWWLDYGTLLGAYRVGELLPWDHDADVGCLASDGPILETARSEFEGLGITVKRHGLRVGEARLDLDRWHRVEGSLRRDTGPRTPWWQWYAGRFDDFPAEAVAAPRRIRLGSGTFPCPADPRSFLRRRFPTLHLHERFCLPHKQQCWFCPEFWRESGRILLSRYQPEILSNEEGPAGIRES